MASHGQGAAKDGQGTLAKRDVPGMDVTLTTLSELDPSSPTKRAAHMQDGDVGLDVTLAELHHMTVNVSFVTRAVRILRLALQTPWSAPRLWALILLNLGFQCAGAYVLQSQLYILATGRDNNYPGLSGCLKSGCGGAKAPGSMTLINQYYGDFFWMFALSMSLVILMSFTGDIINSLCRMNAADNIQRRLLSPAGMLMYRSTVDGTMDGLDQRMTSDLQVVLDGFTCVLFGNSADYLAYPVGFMATRMGCAMSNVFALPDIQDAVLRGNIMGVIMTSVAVAITAYMLPINVVAKIFFRGQKYEGNFRTTHTRAVLNCEQITTLRGEPAEKELADKQFKRVDENNRLYYLFQGLLLVLRLIVTISQPAVAYMCLSITPIRNSTTANFFQKQAGDILEYILYFPVLVMRLAFACGATHRVGQLLERMDRLERSPLKTNIEFDNQRIELAAIKANPPEKMDDASEAERRKKKAPQDLEAPRPYLFHNVSLRVDHGQSVCIMGPSGCGKSSLLRIIAGLWGIDEGKVTRPQAAGKGGVFFLPQRPYVFPGSLMAQLEYPDAPSGGKEEEAKAHEVLKLVFLDHLVDRYGLEHFVNWDTVLSTGDMQRLSAARMFFHEPKFCLADECTSALDLKMESWIYRQCTQRGISMISVAHRPSVIPHHESVFKYTAATRVWSLVPSKEYAPDVEKWPIDGLGEDGTQEQAPEEAEEEDAVEGFNMTFVRRFARALRLGIPSWRSSGVAFLATMVVCMGVYGLMTCIIFQNYGTSIIISKVTGTGGYQRDVNSALNFSGIILSLNVVSSVVQALSAFLGSLLAVNVHKAIVRRFHDQYFQPGVLYHINRVMKERGIDQRMVQDLAGFRESLGWIFGNPFCYCNYRVGAIPLLIVWTICLIYAFTNTWQLTVFLLVFMVASYLAQFVTAVFTSRIVGRRQGAEGNLRLHLGRVLQSIEAITFFGGEGREFLRAEHLLERVTHQRLQYNYLANASSFPTIVMYYWLQTGIYVMAAVVQTKWAPGAIPPATLFTTINFNIIWAKQCELIIMCFGGIGMVIGYTHRVMRVLEKLEVAVKDVDAAQGAIQSSPDKIVFDHVNVTVPGTHSRILQDLDFTVPASACFMGPGKSSIVRALAGMWPTTSGKISRPAFGTGGIFIVPQTNYACQGTLAAQIIYPKRWDEVSPTDGQLLHILDRVGLLYLNERWGLHKVVNWEMVLSGGECQRLGFARVLFHRPRFAVLDETSSALDMALEQKCIQALLDKNMELLSLTARPSVQSYHTQNFQLGSASRSKPSSPEKPSLQVSSDRKEVAI